MIQLIAGCKAFHSKYSKTNIDVQDVNSSFSFDQTWNLCIKLKRKQVTITGKEMAHELMEITRRIWDLIAGRSSVAKNSFYKSNFWYQLSDEEIIAINGRDCASFWMNRRLVMIIRSWSCGWDLSVYPSIANNLDRYNSRDWRSRSSHLSEYLITCVIWRSRGPGVHLVDLIACITIKYDAPHSVACPAIKELNEILVPHRRIYGESRVYRVRNLYQVIILSSDNRKTYKHYVNIYIE